MSLLVGFNPEDVEDDYQKTLIPEGKYRVIVSKAEELVSRAGAEYVRYTFTIVYGKLDGTSFEIPFFPNTSDNAMNAFRGFTKKLCRALKLASVKRAEDLTDKPVIAHVKINKYTDRSGELRQSNKIDSFEPDRAPAGAARRQPPPPPEREPADFGQSPGYEADPPPF